MNGVKTQRREPPTRTFDRRRRRGKLTSLTDRADSNPHMLEVHDDAHGRYEDCANNGAEDDHRDIRCRE